MSNHRALKLHRQYRGKVQTAPKCPVRGLEDFAIWYTPGVAEATCAIARDPEQSWDLTNRSNTVAVVTDGTRVLGLGNVGPLAAMPVMEGKALLFKILGGVDAIPICADVLQAKDLVAFVKALEPSFGAINLEDIEAPKCFEVLETLRPRLGIPVWHDDQQGTATVTLAAVRNAMHVVGKSMTDARYVLVGMGAANTAVYRLLRAAGVPPEAIVGCDSRGILHAGRQDIAADRERLRHKWEVCVATDPSVQEGGIADALRGADICIAFSRPLPGLVDPAWVRTMARDPIVFACANPLPEIWPAQAKEAGAAIVATGRSDFPNQVNNALAFPGIFRGVLDVRARAITDEMAIAAADALSAHARLEAVTFDRILPRLDDWRVAPELAAAVAARAMATGIARMRVDAEAVRSNAIDAIRHARRLAAEVP